MKASKILEKKTINYCVSERIKRRKLTYNYGTVCVGVEDSAHIIQVCSHSFKNNASYVYHQCLKDRLSRIGIIGVTLSASKTCVLGYCAEPHAANALLSRLNHGYSHPVVTNTSKFVFTQALRVRTQQKVKYCKFCKQTFPQL